MELERVVQKSPPLARAANEPSLTLLASKKSNSGPAERSLRSDWAGSGVANKKAATTLAAIAAARIRAAP
jgi:hypothetical protein